MPFVGKKWTPHESFRVRIYFISKFYNQNRLVASDLFRNIQHQFLSELIAFVRLYAFSNIKYLYLSFDSSCLQSWLEQDTSCPTCRLGLSVQNAASIHPDIERIIDEQENTTRANNHFFHFNGKVSRSLYLEYFNGIFIA